MAHIVWRGGAAALGCGLLVLANLLTACGSAPPTLTGPRAAPLGRDLLDYRRVRGL